MTLERLRPVSDRLLEPLVRLSLAIGLGPHALSLIGFACALVAAGAFVAGGWWYVLGAVLVLGNGVFDLLDGAVARERATSSSAGDVLDHTLDRYADIVLVGGLAAAIDAFLLGFVAITGVVMTSYLGTQAQAVGYGRLYAGVVGRSDRLALIGLAAVLMAIHPAPVWAFTVVGWLLIALAVVGHVTALQRFVVLWRGLE